MTFHSAHDLLRASVSCIWIVPREVGIDLLRNDTRKPYDGFFYLTNNGLGVQYQDLRVGDKVLLHASPTSALPMVLPMVVSEIRASKILLLGEKAPKPCRCGNPICAAVML